MAQNIKLLNSRRTLHGSSLALIAAMSQVKDFMTEPQKVKLLFVFGGLILTNKSLYLGFYFVTGR